MTPLEEFKRDALHAAITFPLLVVVAIGFAVIA